MKRKEKSAPGSRGVKIAAFFSVLILLLIGGALVMKCLLIFSRSRFDGAHQFVLQVNEPSENKTAFFIFAPDTKSITTLTVNSLKSSTTAARMLQIPTDGQITTYQLTDPKDVGKDLLLHFSSLHPSLTIFDAANLFFYSFGVPTNNVMGKEVTYPLDASSQKVVTQLLTDQTLYREGYSISVVNAAGVSGLGTQVANLLSHMGGNVVSVTTADKEQETSTISYIGQETYTVKRLQKVLQFPLTKMTTSGLSDIVVTVGTKDASHFAL